MMYAQFLRIQSRAGGVAATPRDLIRVARKMLRKSARRDPSKREARHRWYREILDYQEHARQEYRQVMRGMC